MSRSTVLALLCALVVAIVASPASAKQNRSTHFTIRTLSDVHVGTSKLELQAQIDRSTTVLSFFTKRSWMRATRHSSCLSVPWQTTCQRARSTFKAHSWLRSLASERMETLYPPPPVYSTSAWECIHRYEGSWTDPDAPYYGGLQMDLSFQSTYGASLLATKGTADHWTPGEQMAVAQKAHDSGRGYEPWPNTARACGLL